MKRFILTLAAVAAMTLGASAQNNFYVGGTVGLGVDGGDGGTTVGFVLEPEAGWYFNEKMAVGAKIGFTDVGGNDVNTFKFTFAPYYRWVFASVGNVEFFGDAALKIGSETTSIKLDGKRSVSDSGFRIGFGLTPGLMVNAFGNFKIIANLITLGYEHSTLGRTNRVNFGLNFITMGPSVGIEYRF